MVIPMPSFRSGGNNFETNSTFVSFGFKTNVSFIFPFVSTHAVSAANTRILAGTAGESRKNFKKLLNAPTACVQNRWKTAPAPPSPTAQRRKPPL